MRVRACILLPLLALFLFVFMVSVSVEHDRRKRRIYGPEIPLAWHNPMPRAKGSC